MNLSTIVFLIFVGLAMLGYLYYGWLLLQTVMPGTSFEIKIGICNLRFKCLFFWAILCKETAFGLRKSKKVKTYANYIMSK